MEVLISFYISLVSEGADNAMGSICFFNLIVYGVWTTILIAHRSELSNTSVSINQNARSDAPAGSAAIDGDDYDDN